MMARDGSRAVNDSKSTRRCIDGCFLWRFQEEARCQRSQLELSAVRQEMEKKLNEKDEEIDQTRKAHARSMESMQNSLESESRARADVSRQKKKVEADLADLEVALESTNRARAEAEKTVKKLQQQARELQMSLEEEQRFKDEVVHSLAAPAQSVRRTQRFSFVYTRSC